MSRKAFTLVELLVVIGIIALLISILLPSLNKARDAAKKITCGSNLHNIGIAIHNYASNNRGMSPVHDAVLTADPNITGSGTMYWMVYMIVPRTHVPSGTMYNTGRTNLGLIIPYLHKNTGVIFCPSNRYYGGDDNFSLEYWWQVWDDPAAFAWPYLPSSYDYRNIYYSDPLGSKNLKGRLATANNSAIVADMITNGSQPWAPRAARNVHLTGYSVLFGDGSVRFVRDDKEEVFNMHIPYERNSAGALQAWTLFEQDR
jgi:prepilin-type N-terminal cleavage/methylation domain-containing protein